MLNVRLKRPRHYLYNYMINNKNRYLFDSKSLLLVSTKACFLKANHIETMRRILSRKIKGRRGKVYVRVRVSLPYTQKSKQSRMGKGKGKIKQLFCRVNVGDPLYELIGKRVNVIRIRFLARKLHHKFPLLGVRMYNRADGICRNEIIRRR